MQKNNLQLFVFQYDNINAKIRIVITILGKRNKSIKILILFKYHDYINVFDEIDINKQFQHRFHDYAIETTNNLFSILFIICLLRNLKFEPNV